MRSKRRVLGFHGLLAGVVVAACGGGKVPATPPAAPQSVALAPAIETKAIRQEVIPPLLDPELLSPQPATEYLIGIEDELQISVYGYTDLYVSQTVRPDGKIAFPLAGTVQASGQTPEALEAAIATRLEEFVRDPRVTVVVSSYNSKRLVTIGELNAPGIIPVGSEITLLEGISRAGGLTDEADLAAAMLVRDGDALPVSFERLLRKGDLSQNVMLRPNDVLLVPNVASKKIFVLGAVREPQVVTARFDVSLVESIALAGGVTREAQPKNVLIIRGGLAEPELLTVDLRALTQGGDVSQNLPLVPGDIVYVPRSIFADVVEFFGRVREIVSPIVLVETLFDSVRPVAIP